MKGMEQLGFHGKPDPDEPQGPNRAQRRAQAQAMKRQQRRGRRAWERRKKLRAKAMEIVGQMEDQA